MTIPLPILDILKQCRLWPDGLTLTLPQQLDRSTYQEVMKVIQRLGGKWNRSKQAHIFDSDVTEALDAVIMTGEVRAKINELDFFPTPPQVCQQMVDLAQFDPELDFLEPSAGDGAILKAIAKNGINTGAAVEFDPIKAKHVETLYGEILFDHSVTVADFLTVKATPERMVDRVLMNPPFSKSRDIKHVAHAWNFLRPGGRLVAITCPGWQYRQNRAHEDFRKFVQQFSAVEPIELPAGTFKLAGTNVRTVLIVLDKP